MSTQNRLDFITEIQWENIDLNDWPDLVDAYISSAYWLDTQEELTDDELDELNDKYLDQFRDDLEDSYRGNLEQYADLYKDNNRL